MLKLLGHLFLIILLTILTQVGGLAYLLAYLISKYLRYKTWKMVALFCGFYAVLSFVITPLVSPYFGRRPLPLSGYLEPANYLTCLLNRHYVAVDLHKLLIEISEDYYSKYDVSLIYLDANFPFLDGFPLFPQLSHNDGRKVDLAFSYNHDSGERTDAVPSWLGYGVYEEPKEKEISYARICAEKGYWQYSLLKRMVFGKKNYLVDGERTSWVIQRASREPGVSKIFLEPHLKVRWGFSSDNKVRFHGCQAVRHDDHIHLQIR